MTASRYEGASELAEDARRLLSDIERDVPGAATITTDCRPPLDILETSAALEIVVDVPGVSPESIRIAVRRSTLLVVGAKLASPLDRRARFHLAERSYGRFARAGQLRIVLCQEGRGGRRSENGPYVAGRPR